MLHTLNPQVKSRCTVKMDFTSAFNVSAAQWTSRNGLKTLTINSAEDLKGCRVGVTWVALTVTDVAVARRILRDDFGFHPVAIEDALSDRERPGMFSDDHYVFATIPVVGDNEDGFCYTHLGLFVAEHLLVSVTTYGNQFVDEWFDRWKAHPSEVGSRSDMLMQELLDAAVDDYFPALDKIQTEVDLLEEHVYSGGKLEVGDAIRSRRKLLEMRRQVTPIRDVLNALLRRDTPVIKNDTRAYLQDVYDHTLRVLESVDLNRDILTSIMDAQLSVQSNRLNEVMKNMTSLATVFMAMSLLTGIYGMNFDHMPELHWKNGYLYVMIALAVVFFGGLGIATKIGWFTVNLPWRSARDDSP